MTFLGAEDTAIPFDYDSDENDPTDGTRTSQESILPAFMFDPSLDNKIRSKLIEKEMNEQAKIITDLRYFFKIYIVQINSKTPFLDP